jgi:hypothetical protein
LQGEDEPSRGGGEHRPQGGRGSKGAGGAWEPSPPPSSSPAPRPPCSPGGQGSVGDPGGQSSGLGRKPEATTGMRRQRRKSYKYSRQSSRRGRNTSRTASRSILPPLSGSPLPTRGCLRSPITWEEPILESLPPPPTSSTSSSPPTRPPLLPMPPTPKPSHAPPYEPFCSASSLISPAWGETHDGLLPASSTHGS